MLCQTEYMYLCYFLKLCFSSLLLINKYILLYRNPVFQIFSWRNGTSFKLYSKWNYFFLLLNFIKFLCKLLELLVSLIGHKLIFIIMKRLYKITSVSQGYWIIFLYFKVLVHIGEWGSYQKFLFFMLCIPACLPAAFIAFNQVGL